MSSRDVITTNGTRRKIKMRQLIVSIHKDMSAYLMDFGFGGFVGYGGGVASLLV